MKPEDAIKKCPSEHISDFLKLIKTWLALFKESGLSIDEVVKRAMIQPDAERMQAFLDIFRPIYNDYQQHLAHQQKVDFADMIRKAASSVEKGSYKVPYHYILVDEFQDISIGRARLLKAAQNQNDQLKLFCVGDDWQSIYRFAGGDVSIMLDFENHFGFTRRTVLDRSFRLPQQLEKRTSEFIQRNPRQIKKQLTSFGDRADALEVVKTDEIQCTVKKSISGPLDAIISEAKGSPVSILLLGRYKHDQPDDLRTTERYFSPSNAVRFLTIHSAKGLEADYVILLNCNAGKYGLPSEVIDDPVLRLVLSDQDDYPNSEERRVFYVGLTRAKKKAFIITCNSRHSKFLEELCYSDRDTQRCSRCGTGFMVERRNRKDGSTFLSCTNWPYCSSDSDRMPWNHLRPGYSQGGGDFFAESL